MMTNEEFAQWGKEENERRKTEMEQFARGEVELKDVQAACAKRRKAVRLSVGQAAHAVMVAQRMERGESLSFALR